MLSFFLPSWWASPPTRFLHLPRLIPGATATLHRLFHLCTFICIVSLSGKIFYHLFTWQSFIPHLKTNSVSTIWFRKLYQQNVGLFSFAPTAYSTYTHENMFCLYPHQDINTLRKRSIFSVSLILEASMALEETFKKMHTQIENLEKFSLKEVFTQVKTLKRATMTSNLRCEPYSTLYWVEYFIWRIIFLGWDEFHVCRGNVMIK